MSDFQQFLQYKALARKFSLQNTEFSESLIESGVYPAIQLRNVCAKLTVELADRLDRTCSNLSVSKRQFIEVALIEAMDQADSALNDCGVWDELDKQLEQK